MAPLSSPKLILCSHCLLEPACKLRYLFLKVILFLMRWGQCLTSHRQKMFNNAHCQWGTTDKTEPHCSKLYHVSVTFHVPYQCFTIDFHGLSGQHAQRTELALHMPVLRAMQVDHSAHAWKWPTKSLTSSPVQVTFLTLSGLLSLILSQILFCFSHTNSMHVTI